MLCEAGYIGGYPDKRPIRIAVECRDQSISILVSKHLPFLVFVSWLANTYNMPVRNLDPFLKKKNDSN